MDRELLPRTLIAWLTLYTMYPQPVSIALISPETFKKITEHKSKIIMPKYWIEYKIISDMLALFIFFSLVFFDLNNNTKFSVCQIKTLHLV